LAHTTAKVTSATIAKIVKKIDALILEALATKPAANQRAALAMNAVIMTIMLKIIDALLSKRLACLDGLYQGMPKDLVGYAKMGLRVSVCH
jgi:hypothetical protein